MNGVVDSIFPSHGFAFLKKKQEEESERDIFAHYKNFKCQGHFCLIQKDEPVEFELEFADSRGPRAINIRLVNQYEVPTKDVLAEVTSWDGDTGFAAHTLCGCRSIFLIRREFQDSFVSDRLSVGDRIVVDLGPGRGRSAVAKKIRIIDPEEQQDGSSV